MSILLVIMHDRVYVVSRRILIPLLVNRTSYPGNVSLSLSGLPAGASYFFNPHPVQGQVTNLNISTVNSTPLATFTLTISATATGITINPITVVLNVVP